MKSAEETIKRIVGEVKSPESAFEAGRHYAEHGASERNCHFGFFRTKESTKEWERGRDERLKELGLAVLLLCLGLVTPVQAEDDAPTYFYDPECSNYGTNCHVANCKWLSRDRVECKRECTKDEEFERDRRCSASREAWAECQREAWGCRITETFKKEQDGK